MKSKADPNIKRKVYWMHGLAYVSMGCCSLCIQGDGWTALHFAAKHGNVEIVEALLKGGAEVGTKEEVI